MEPCSQKIVQEQFYKKAEDYWSEIPATIDGMLGGFGHISDIDIRSSRQFLKLIFQSKNSPCKQHAVDCGAGIGRITRNLLAPIFDKVDLVEQNPTFLEQAKEYLGPRLLDKIGNFYPVGLQDFQPENNKYDVIWCQWVLGHLTDEHLMHFLESCKHGLKESGMVIIKENVTSTMDVEFDEKDSSTTRPFHAFMKLFKAAGFCCLQKIKQRNFPKGLYPVYMFALQPKKIIT